MEFTQEPLTEMTRSASPVSSPFPARSVRPGGQAAQAGSPEVEFDAFCLRDSGFQFVAANEVKPKTTDRQTAITRSLFSPFCWLSMSHA